MEFSDFKFYSLLILMPSLRKSFVFSLTHSSSGGHFGTFFSASITFTEGLNANFYRTYPLTVSVCIAYRSDKSPYG